MVEPTVQNSFVSGSIRTKVASPRLFLRHRPEGAENYLMPVQCSTRAILSAQSSPGRSKRLACATYATLSQWSLPSCVSDYRDRPRSDHRGVELVSDALPFGRLWYGEPNAASSAVGCAQFYFAFLVWDSVRARHTSIAETAVRPSQGRRSKNVITMVALS
jgi:hypothetical protein